MLKPLLQHLLRAAANLPFFVVAFFCIRFARLLQCFVFWQITFAGAQLHIKTVQSFPSPLLPLMLAAVYYLLFSLCLLLPFVLNCDAKVQTYLQPTKHFTKNLCIFNLLQQISMFLPKFIHILSTKTGKCAIYKANIFAFGCNTRVHYIITNNNAAFAAVRIVLLQLICAVLMQCAFQNYHHYKTDYLCQITTTTNYVIYLCRVRVSFVACRMLLPIYGW